MFCCHGFKNLINNAGRRGISALVEKRLNGIKFLLQSRGIDFSDESKISTNPISDNYTVNVSCTIGLQFCPFCGRKLQELVRSFPNEFNNIAQDHNKFISGSLK